MRVPFPPTTAGATLAVIFSMTLLLSAGVTAQAQRQWVITDLGTLGGDESAAYGVNNRGDVVGVSRLGEGQAAPAHAFLWTAREGMLDLGVPAGGVFSIAYSVNERRQVVGSYLVLTPSPHERAFIWSPQDGFTDHGPGIAHDVNNRGQVVGVCTVAPGVVHACLIENGAVIDLGTLGGATSTANAINERGWVVGESETADGSVQAFLWTMTLGMIPLEPSSAQGIAHDVSNAGIIAIDRDQGAFLLVRDEFVEVSVPDAAPSTVLGVSESGLAVGAVSISLGPQTAFASVRGAFVDLGTLGGDESVAFAVNNRGTIVGRAQTSSGEIHAVLWSNAVSER